MIIEENAGHHGPDLTEIECSNCIHCGTFEWRGEVRDAAGSSKCAKYDKKPKGVLYPINKSKENMKGTYIKCPCYEAK